MTLPDQSDTTANVRAWLSPAWAEHLIKIGIARRDGGVLYMGGAPTRQGGATRRRWHGSQGRMDRIDEAQREADALDQNQHSTEEKT